MNTSSTTNNQPLPDLTVLQLEPHLEATSTPPCPEGLVNRTTTTALSVLSSSPLERRGPTDHCDSYLDILPAFVQNYILSFLKYPELRFVLPAFTTFQDGIPDCVLERFGLPHLEAKNKELFFKRINTILDTLKNSSIPNFKEKAFFKDFTAENLFTEQNSLYYVLDSAYNCSLVAPFLKDLDYSIHEMLKRKVNCVRGHIEKRKKWITLFSCPSEKMVCFPDEICSSLPQLKTLNLSHNHLTQLPKSIGQLSALSQLNLSHNHLTSLPESFGQLSALTELNLEHNQLTSLPESLKQFLKQRRIDPDRILSSQRPQKRPIVLSDNRCVKHRKL